MEALLGSVVINGKKEKIPTSSLQGSGKIIGLYFSAHWCPPCRGFTPILAQFYNTMKAKGVEFEVVFISSDQDEGSFYEYFGSMPWLALPFSDRAQKQKVSEKYGVRGIPTLVLLDGSTLNTVCANARSHVQNDPQGARFPYRD